MKDWFPFTNYDFYGYLTCGLVLLFVSDYWYSGGHYLFRNEWNFFDGTLLVAVAYVTGQIIAMPSSILLENLLARTILRPPLVIMLSSTQKRHERWIACLFVGRHYAPLPSSTRDRIYAKAQKQTGKSKSYLQDNSEEVFMPAYTQARNFEDTRQRMDDFRNQYGFNRNMALSGIVSAGLLFHRAWRDSDHNAEIFGILALLLSFGMFVRFLKFYSAFAAEVLRTYAFQKVGK